MDESIKCPKFGAENRRGLSQIQTKCGRPRSLAWLTGATMADLRSQRRIEELEGDREALEHIARALEGRVLPGPGAIATSEAARPADSLALTPAGLAILLESMPAAVGILAGGARDSEAP